MLRARLQIFFLTIFLLSLTFAGISSAQERITISGSDTLIFLGQRFADIYQGKLPQASLTISGGGKNKAVSRLISGESEIAQFEGTGGLPGRDFASFPVGVQAIVVYVNQANPVKALTLAQVRSIFMGEITNWKALGGPDLEIHLYAGESSTGTLDYFQESVLQGQEPYPFVGKSNTKALLEEIASHREAIGYGSLGQAPGARPISIKFGPASLAIDPNSDNIRSRKYPITRYVWWAVAKDSRNSVKELCEWVLAPEGQLVVESVGFEPLRPAERALGLANFHPVSGTHVARARP
jgi:phosphate transport system substrate-binding protein